MKAIHWDSESLGMKFKIRDIPKGMVADCRKAREFMVEAAAEASEVLMDKYLGVVARSETRACRQCWMRLSLFYRRRQTGRR